MVNKFKKSLSVLIPAYNEGGHIKDNLRLLQSYLFNNFNDFELVVVESGSTDGTNLALEELKREFSNLKVFNQGKRLGYGNAIRFGILKCELDYIFITDADEPFDLENIGKAIGYLDEYDAIIGYRTGGRESFGRWFYSKGFNILIKLLFGIRVKDINFSFKIIKRIFLKDFNLYSNKWFIDAEIQYELKRNKVKFKEIPIKYKTRTSGVSSADVGPKIVKEMLKEMIYYWRKKY